MSVVFNVKNKDVEIKFNYRMMFKANKHLGSINSEGNRNDDGASNLFNRILSQEDEAIFDLIKLAHTGSKTLTDDELFDAVENKLQEYMNDSMSEKEAYNQLFEDVKGEMFNSGFFMRKLENQIKNMEQGKKLLAQREDQTSKEQVLAITDLLDKMQKEISLGIVQE